MRTSNGKRTTQERTVPIFILSCELLVKHAFRRGGSFLQTSRRLLAFLLLLGLRHIESMVNTRQCRQEEGRFLRWFWWLFWFIPLLARYQHTVPQSFRRRAYLDNLKIEQGLPSRPREQCEGHKITVERWWRHEDVLRLVLVQLHLRVHECPWLRLP